MKRTAIALTLMALVCSQSLAQESKTKKSESRKPEMREAARGDQRGADRKRREYVRPKITVKNPADFNKDGKQIFSGPQPGEKLRSFLATSLAGDNKGTELDPTKLAGKNPQIILFQDGNGVALRGLFGIADAVQKIDRKTEQDLRITCVFLSDDVETIASQSEVAGVFPRLVERGIDLIAISKDGHTSRLALADSKDGPPNRIFQKSKISKKWCFLAFSRTIHFLYNF